MNVETHKIKVTKTSAWLSALRLRTLPLALASTITGVSLAVQYGFIDWWIALMTALTTILLQLNSNLANDYGDFLKGTDSKERIGPERALQSGILRPEEMKKAIILFSALSLLCGLILLYISRIELIAKAALLVAGVLAIYASVKYTAGSNPYGYKGLGDVSVMVFFGILGVIGAFYLQVNELPLLIVLPAVGIGAFSAGVLNVNNTRDRLTDINTGKITLAVKLGEEYARLYQVVLMTLGVMSFIGYAIACFQELNDWLFVICMPLFLFNAYKVYTIRDDAKLDPYLKQLALSTFFLALLIAVGVWL